MPRNENIYDQFVINTLEARIAALEKDAARWNQAKKDFRVTSAVTGGNHHWDWFGHDVRGLSMNDAMDKQIAAMKEQQQ